MWTEIRRYRSGAPDGGIEEFVLEKDENGNFRIRNDFGNSVFEFERMAGYEFFRKVSRDVGDDLEDELNELWTNVDMGDSDSDGCDDYTGAISGSDIDSQGYGAD